MQHSRSPSCALYSAPTRQRQLARPLLYNASRRTFLDNLFSKSAPREVRQPTFDPGWMKIMVWRSRMLDNVRPPPDKELIQAWRAFFDSKISSRLPLNATQALQCHRLLNYLVEQLPEAPAKAPQLKPKDLITALQALRPLRPRERASQHLQFTQRLYSVLNSGVLGTKELDPAEKTWADYIKALVLYGGSKEAAEVLRSNWVAAAAQHNAGASILPFLARGLAREGNGSDLVSLVNDAEKNGMPLDSATHEEIVTFFAERNMVAETKQWFEQLSLPTAACYPLIASFAVRNGLQEWAVPYFLKLGDTRPPKPYWDSLLQAILIMGKGLKQVGTMMSHMVDKKGPVAPDAATINGLLRAAVRMKDSVLAEDILLFAEEKSLKLDGETYLIQMSLRLDAGYLPGVQAAYKNVKKLEPWQIRVEHGWEYSELLNKYLRTLCDQPTPDFKLIVELVNAAEEDQVQLDPETVSKLCVRFLENEQAFDVMDTLSIHAFQFSAAEREVVQEAFVNFCLSPETSTARAWTAYQLLRQFFQDLSFERRESLVAAFFDRKRPDMAFYVFGHMRAHRNIDYHPKLETYVIFFEGLGRCPDVDSLEMVFNMLKMDTTLQPDTKLYTALMIAYTACGKPVQAMDFWENITASREGPSYASLEAVFWALERKPSGAKMAHRVWKRIESMDIDVPPVVFNAYVGAVAGSAELEEAQNAILRMGRVTGAEPDAMT